MDNRKLDTGAVLALGIIDAPALPDPVPPDATLVSVSEDNCTEPELRDALESGGIRASMYYGCFQIWRTESGFSGELHQYRAVTGRFDNEPLEIALQTAVERAGGCWG